MKTLELTVLLLVAACGVEARVQNSTNDDFDSVKLGPHEFGSLAAGEVTEYVGFDTLYEREFVRVVVDRRALDFQPIDHVGEEPLDSGAYTFEIRRVDFDQNRLEIEMRAD